MWEDDWIIEEDSYIDESEFDKAYFEDIVKLIEEEA